MHGSCIDNSIFIKYTGVALMNNKFAYSGLLLGQKLENIILNILSIQYVNGLNTDSGSKRGVQCR